MMSVAEGRSEPPPSHVGVRHDLAGIDCEAFAADQARCDACLHNTLEHEPEERVVGRQLRVHLGQVQHGRQDLRKI